MGDPRLEMVVEGVGGSVFLDLNVPKELSTRNRQTVWAVWDGRNIRFASRRDQLDSPTSCTSIKGSLPSDGRNVKLPSGVAFRVRKKNGREDAGGAVNGKRTPHPKRVAIRY